MDSQRNLQNLVKSKIEFTTADGNFEGVVRLVCPVTKKIIIEQLFFLPKSLFIGVLHFNMSEIISFKVISQSQNNTGEQLPVLHRMHKELSSDIEVDSEALPKEERYILKLPQWPNVILPTDSVILNCINEQFHQSVSHIQQQNSIGAYLGGPSIGRDGILSWLAITTPNCIFLFDIQVLKEKVFNEGGLRDLLQNPRIEKILHDCRNASDCLYHQFDTNLINVFDTQVADLFVTMQSNKKGSTLQKVNTLSTCLTKYLDVPNLCLPKTKHRSNIENVLHYSLRPLRNETRDLLVKSVVYLRLLKQRLNRLLLNPFHRAVEVYLQVVQGASDQEILLEPSCEEDVPLQLIMGGLQTIRLQNSSLDPSSENNPRNAIENNTSLFKNNSGKDTNIDTSGFGKLLHRNDVYLGTRRTSPHTKNFNEPSEGSKNDFLDENYAANFRKFPQVVSKHTQYQSINASKVNIKLSFVNSGECSGVDKSPSQTDINVTSRHTTPKRYDHPYTNNRSVNIDYKKNSNGDYPSNSRDVDKFRLSNLRFNKNSNCQAKQSYNGGNNAEENMTNVKSASIESTQLSKNSFVSDRGKSKRLPNLEGDPYAKLKEAFSDTDDAYYERKAKLKFFPAGMANKS